MFKNFFNGHIKKEHKKAFALFCVAVIIISFAAPYSAHAQLNPFTAVANRVAGAVTDTVGGWIVDGIAWMASEVADLALQFALISGWVLDYAVYFSLNIGALVDGGNDLNFVKFGWGQFRNLANLFFIFILLYIAATTVLNVSGHNTRALLAQTIVVAFLVNFSFFISGLIIDVTNVAGGTFYQNICLEDECLRVGDFSKGIAYIWGDAMKIQTLKDVAGATSEEMIAIASMAAVFFAIAGFVFLSMAMIFIGRTITLAFLLMLSPFGFVAFLLPGVRSYASRYWSMLINESLIAPVFLFLMFVLSRFLGGFSAKENFGDGIGAPSGSPHFGEAIKNLVSSSPDPQNVHIIFSFVMMIGFLIASLAATRSLAGHATQAMAKLGTKGLAFGIGAGIALARYGGGYARAKVGQSSTMAKIARYQPTSKFGRAGYGAFKGVGKVVGTMGGALAGGAVSGMGALAASQTLTGVSVKPTLMKHGGEYAKSMEEKAAKTLNQFQKARMSGAPEDKAWMRREVARISKSRAPADVEAFKRLKETPEGRGVVAAQEIEKELAGMNEAGFIAKTGKEKQEWADKILQNQKVRNSFEHVDHSVFANMDSDKRIAMLLARLPSSSLLSLMKNSEIDYDRRVAIVDKILKDSDRRPEIEDYIRTSRDRDLWAGAIHMNPLPSQQSQSPNKSKNPYASGNPPAGTP
ncbi:hypothetical protein L0Y49_00635 [bacterium]|nr:hypothetical protein [bacterium]MCI0565821.1 hypothetical protein [bacterium]